jgi:3',5'-cyclic AMP phosphodiesterase CpdA
MSVLLQVSDPHFGTEQAPVVEALVTFALLQRPDLVVLSGDITQRARPSQFRAARAFMERLAAPMLAIPGNHDIPLFDVWARWRRPYAAHMAVFGHALEPVHSSPDMLVVCVNTTRAWRHKDGEVSAQQIERVARLLVAAKASQLRVVVVHQPAAVTRVEDVKNLLHGHAQALQRWSTAGADLVLGGHIHLPYVQDVQALHGLARPVWAVQAGTAVSSRVRQGAPNSVNVLRWNEAEAPSVCQIEQWDFSTTEQAFVCARVTQVRPFRT